MTSSSVSGDTEIFFKNGQTFIKVNGVNSRFYYKDGKLLWKESGIHDVNTLTNLLKQYA